jgi:hypothetical protein
VLIYHSPRNTRVEAHIHFSCYNLILCRNSSSCHPTYTRSHHHSIAAGAAILFTSTSRRRHRCKSFFSLETALTLTSLQPQTLSSHPAMSATSNSDASSMSDTSVVDSDDPHISSIVVKVSSGYLSRRQDWRRYLTSTTDWCQPRTPHPRCRRWSQGAADGGPIPY